MTGNGTLALAPPDTIWPTGFRCQECGKEAVVRIMPPEGGCSYYLLRCHMDRLDREGGTLRSGACEHTIQVRPGSRAAAEGAA